MIADLLILVVLAVGGYFGYRKGFLIEIISVFAFIIATMTAFKLMHTTLEFFRKHLDHDSLAPVLGFVSVFLGVFFLIFLLGKFLTRMLSYTLFGSFDKVAGTVVGIIKYAFSISVILWLLHVGGVEKIYSKSLSGAILYPYVLNFASQLIQWISHVIPFTDVFDKVKKVV